MRLWIGGWYHNYDFIGDIDEVRVSKVKRSADWVKLQYENQKANSALFSTTTFTTASFQKTKVFTFNTTASTSRVNTRLLPPPSTNFGARPSSG